VFARGVTRLSGAIDHVVAQFEVPGAGEVHAEGSWIMGDGFAFSMTYTVVFERAMADYDIARGPDALRLYEEGQAPRTITPPGIDGYTGELDHMIQSIQTGRPPHRVTARDALSAVEICEAEERSISTSTIVTL
jgi:predicted dehydrogenase